MRSFGPVGVADVIDASDVGVSLTRRFKLVGFFISRIKCLRGVLLGAGEDVGK